MLETKNLTKIYKPKRGVPVKALNGLSIKFNETGMVFLLGKSGSGKSTLLHLLGGLDSYTDGEIIIKGVSSKNFRQKHFDSYRNTYVGFIFQDYNVLDDFTVGANIGLALELQGKKATDEKINEILNEVDLFGFGDRKPNELSGGQKQRVAIARALVKNPHIIMADEPTGALDSITGKQVFDTLKKLSTDKLVIVVSHDRDFAENYADRIIELADGNIVSDVSYDNSKDSVTENINFSDDIITVKKGYHLTEEDRIKINEYIESSKTDAKIKIINTKSNKFKPTDESKIAFNLSDTFKLIKSKLPLKSSVKIGASGLKHKKFRLVITIFLSCIAFGLFGLSDTFGSYDNAKTTTNSIIDTKIDYASLSKGIKIKYGEGEKDYYFLNGYSKLTEEEIQKISKGTDIKYLGVYTPLSANLDFIGSYDEKAEFTQTDYHIYPTGFNGFVEIDENILNGFGLKIMAGNLPDFTKNEIGISEYICRTFMIGGYTDSKTVKNSNGIDEYVYQAIKSPEDMIGKVLTLNGKKYIISCIIDTGLDIDRYKPLTKEKINPSTKDEILNYALMSELQNIRKYSYSQVIFCGKGTISEMRKTEPTVKPLNPSCSFGFDFTDEDKELYSYLYANYVGTLADIDNSLIKWAGEKKDSLGEKEIIVSSDMTDGEIYDYSYSFSFYNGFSESQSITEDGYKIVGIIDTSKNPNLNGILLANESLLDGKYLKDDGFYNYCVGKMPHTTNEVRKIVDFSANEFGDTKYELMNSVTYELGIVDEELAVLSKVFLYIGIGFAIFSAIMLANFISTSIAYKKQEIGILRSIGSRSNDVFRIFFSESFIIAFINFFLSSLGVFIVTEIINSYLRFNIGIQITILSFGIRQILLLFFVSVTIAAVASYIPVKKIASKRPIDAIRDR